ncbi:MAG: hypothetical protein Q9204_003314 [Flavoplaca sp. TL-2023a]
MAAPKRKRRNSPPSYSAQTQSSNAKRVKFSIPLQQGRSPHRTESSASKVPSHSRGILQNKRQREDTSDDDEGLQPKQKFTLCSWPKIKPADGPQRRDGNAGEGSSKNLKEEDEGNGASGERRSDMVISGATAVSVSRKGEQDGNGEAFAEENPAESKTTLIKNDGYEMPSVESDHDENRTGAERSNDSPVEVNSHHDVFSEEDSHNSISSDEEAAAQTSSDEGSDEGSDEDSDEDSDGDSDHDYSIHNHFIGSTHRSSSNHHTLTFSNRHTLTFSNRHTLTFSNQTLISRNIPSGAHLSRCKLISCNTTNATLQSCRVISCNLRSSTAEDCSFVSCDLRDCWIGGCTFVICNISGGSAEGCSYRMTSVRI